MSRLAPLEARALIALRDYDERWVTVEAIAAKTGIPPADTEFAVECLHLRDLATPGPLVDGRQAWMCTGLGEAAAAELERTRFRVDVRVDRGALEQLRRTPAGDSALTQLRAMFVDLAIDDPPAPGAEAELQITLIARSAAEAAARAGRAVNALQLPIHRVHSRSEVLA